MLFDAWENAYYENRTLGIERIKELCKAKIHLQVTTSSKNPISENLTFMEKPKDNSLGPILIEEHVENQVLFLSEVGDGKDDSGSQLHGTDNNTFSTSRLSVNCHDEALSTTAKNTTISPGTERLCAS